MTPSLRWPLLPLAGVLALALLAVFVAPPPAEAQFPNPDAVRNLRVTATTATSVTVTWDPPAQFGLASDATTVWYFHWFRESGAGGYNSSGVQEQQITSHTYTGLTTGQAYDFQVFVCRNQGNSGCGPSATVTATAMAPATSRPDAVTDLSVSLSGTSAALTWTIPADNGAQISSYRLEHNIDGTWAEAYTNNINAHVAVSRTVTNADYTSLTKFRIRHSNSEGDADWSNVVMAGPDAPVLSKGAISGDSADPLSWTMPASSSAITDYEYRSQEKDAATWGAWATTNPMSRDPIPTEFTASRADHGKAYEYQVRAVNSAGEGPASNTLLVAARPSGLGALTATEATNEVSVTLDWSVPANDGGKDITQYLVQWRLDSNNDWGTNGPQGSRFVTSGTSVTIPSGSVGSGLQPNTTYNFRYRAYNEDRHSFFNPNNGSIEATTAMASPPSAPQNLTPTRQSTTSARLTWDAPASDGGDAITDYLIQWKRSEAVNWQGPSVLTLEANTPLQYEVTDIDTTVDYDFRVAAVNSTVTVTNAVWADVMLEGIGASVTPTTLTEGELDGAQLTVDLVGTTYDSALFTSRFVLESPPSGLSITSVNRESHTRAVLTLAFNGDFNADTSFTIRLISTATLSNQVLTTGAVQVTAETAPGVVVIRSADGGAGTVTANWNAVSDADGYKVQWKGPGATFATAAADGRELVITDDDTTTAVIGGLEPSTVYFVRVIATKDLAPDSTPSFELSATTDAISAILDNTNPSPLTERGLDGATLTLDLFGTTYAPSLDASDFGLLPRNVSGLSVVSVNRVSDTRAALTLSFTGNIVANVSLQVVVDGSANAAGSPLTSDTVTVIQAVTPARVSGVSAEPGPASLTVTWRAVSHADGYRVSVRRSADTSDVTIRDVAGGSTNRAGISGLLGDTEYDVRVRALSDFAQEGDWSNPITATTQPGHAIVSATDPSPLTERNLDGAVLTVDLLPGIYDPWAPRLDRAEVTVSGVPGVTTTIADVTRVSDERMLVRLAYDGTDFDTDRVLRVEFYGAHTSIGTITAVADVAAVDEPPPGRVQNVQVTPGPLSVRVTWDPVDDATGYRLEWSPAAAFGSSFHRSWPWPPRYTIGALLPDTEYTVRVVATKTRAPDGQPSTSASATTPAVRVSLVRTEPSPLAEDNLHGARLTVDLAGIEWARLVEGRYYRSQLGWLNDCSEAKYYDNCYPFIVTRSVVVTGIERVSSSRVVVSLWARNVDLQGKGLWIRFPDDMHTHYYGEDDYIVLQVIAPDREDFEIAQNNRGSVTVTAADPVSVTEGGASVTYTVVLDGQPSGNVVITPNSENGDVSMQPASLTFTRDNWATAQTVSVRASHDDDAVDDAAVISHAVSGADGYAGIEVASVSVSVADDDTAGVTVQPTELSVDEGSTATYTVVLDTQPVGNVLISMFASGVTAQPTELTFTPDNWQTPQTVTVSAGQDDDTEDATAAVSHGIGAGPESGYSSVLVPYVIVDIIDDDEAQAQAAQQEPEPETGSVTVSASSLGVREGDDGATYTVSLDVEPTANVTITVSSDHGDVAAEPASLTFTPGNWQSAQTVSVSAGEDADKVDELAIVSHGVSGGNYDGVSVGFVTVIVTDDDTTVEVLRDFYEAAGGGSWSNNNGWLSGRPLAEWHGVTVNEDGEVTGLALRGNNLVGTLAPELGKLERLEVVSLDRNSISGSLPVELGELSNLTRLALNRNSLTGAIPAELGGLTNLSIIGLARNQLSGALPASLGDLTGLTRLSLHDNTGLSGALPSGFTGLVDLERLAIANTGLCAPDDEGFTAWLDGVADKPGGVQTCQ